MPSITQTDQRNGLITGIVAFTLWGLLPIYWKFLDNVSAIEILSHRVFWSLVFITFIITIQKRWSEIKEAFKTKSTIIYMCFTCLLITTNWFLYIWTVNAGNIMETSIGYYINPLVNVALGAIFLGERIRTIQIIAILIVTAGVLNMLIFYGKLPIIALTLAVSFSLYGMLRKKANIKPIPGLFIETLFVSPIFISIIIYFKVKNTAIFNTGDLKVDLLLSGAGVATAIPLLTFAYAAKRLQLATLGIIQYIGPSIAFLLSVFVYHETFTKHHLILFLCIWTALLLYSIESIIFLRKNNKKGV
jgi:chloramphenicol-sensitive protein RarD